MALSSLDIIALAKSTIPNITNNIGVTIFIIVTIFDENTGKAVGILSKSPQVTVSVPETGLHDESDHIQFNNEALQASTVS